MTSSLVNTRFWLLSTAAAVVIATTFSLGQWQLRRAAEKESIQAASEARNSLPPIENTGLTGIKTVADLLYRQAFVRGTWLAAHTVYLDNRPMDGKSGFIALTPLKLDGRPEMILVQRGWVQRNFQDREAIPQILTPPGLVEVQGTIALQPSKLYAFNNVESGRIRQNLDVTLFASEIRLPLLPITLLQTGQASEGLSRNWAPAKRGVEKNYGYAFQWFGLCALTAFLYLWFQVIQPLRLKTHSVHTP